MKKLYRLYVVKELYNLHAEICKVFSNPIRLEILDLLRDKKMSVTELMNKSKLTQANISQHLSIMKSKGIVTSERRSKNIFYKLTNPKIPASMNQLPVNSNGLLFCSVSRITPSLIFPSKTHTSHSSPQITSSLSLHFHQYYHRLPR